MKAMKTIRLLRNLLVTICGLSPILLVAQVDSVKEKRESFLYLRYYVINNQIPYLNVQTKNKVDKEFHPQPGIPVSIYLNKDSDAASLIGKVVTNEKGVAVIGLPATLAAVWKEKSSPTFFARTDSSSNFDAKSEEVSMNKSKLELDTVNDGGVRSVKARLLQYENGSPVPMSEVDIRLSIKRSGGNLNIGEDETYATDSTGTVQGEFSRKDLPGDTLGNLELVALVDDNDVVGTVETHMKVPWGVPAKYVNDFDRRTLYATGNKAPLFLMVIAYGTIAGVWTVIFYLIYNIVQIRKMGTK